MPMPANANRGASQVADPQGVDRESMPLIRQLLRILVRRRYLILGTVVLCMIAGLVATLLMTPQYTATAVVEISRDSSKVTDFQGVERETSIADQEFYQTQYGLLKARSLAERVATELRLIDDPEFFERFNVNQDKPAFQVSNGRYSAAGLAERKRIAGEVLLEQVRIDPTRLSRLVNILFTSSDPAFSAKVANQWAQSFIETNLERKSQATSYGRAALQRQLGQLKERLDQSQRQLVAYAAQERIINLPTSGGNGGGAGRAAPERSIVADELASLNAALSQATADRIQAQARFDQGGKSGATVEALRNIAINNLRQRRAELAAEYQRLMVQFEPGYPAAKAIKQQLDQIDRSIGTEETRVSASLAAEYREAADREQALRSRVEQLKESYLDLRRRSIQYNIYQGEVDTNQALYDGVLQRFKEIGVAGGVGINNIAVVDSADVPQRPSSPRLLLNLLGTFLLGLVFGGLLAFGLEQIDDAVIDPSEVQHRLGLPLLGSVPKLESGTPREALLDRKSQMVDAYLAIQTNLSFTTDHGVPRSLAITSTRPAEGKSTTALAMATMLVRAHRKVVLIDGDMRSPSVHHFGGVSNQQGLSNFLTGAENIDALLFEMEGFGFAAMAAGPIPPNAAELLTGNRLRILIDRLLTQYDHVVIDSPPVMGLADAPLIASQVEGIVYAVESNGIRASLVQIALARLASANVRVFGGILTKFDAAKTHYGHGYEYGYGYGRDDKKSG